MEKKVHEVLIDFDPLRVTLPGPGPFVGKVRVVLPEVHLKLWDLSMGIDLLEGAHIGGDSRAWSVDIEVPEPGITAGDLMEFIAKAEPQLKGMWQIIQKEMDKTFLMEMNR